MGKLNCSAFSDSLLESRLFGYKKGAFTDAKEDTKDIFELANGGSIFYDKIGDISPYMQQSLLRVIQQKEITPVGGSPNKVDIRIIIATNKNLPKECSQEHFRWDLYHRLSTVELKIPSLLERVDKKVVFAKSFFEQPLNHLYNWINLKLWLLRYEAITIQEIFIRHSSSGLFAAGDKEIIRVDCVGAGSNIIGHFL